jgi:hypothetical protein
MLINKKKKKQTLSANIGTFRNQERKPNPFDNIIANRISPDTFCT